MERVSLEGGGIDDGSASRALTVVPERIRSADRRTLPDFLAQLIAAARRLPDQRAARKADPATARGAYLSPLVARRARLDVTV